MWGSDSRAHSCWTTRPGKNVKFYPGFRLNRYSYGPLTYPLMALLIFQVIDTVGSLVCTMYHVYGDTVFTVLTTLLTPFPAVPYFICSNVVEPAYTLTELPTELAQPSAKFTETELEPLPLAPICGLAVF